MEGKNIQCPVSGCKSTFTLLGNARKHALASHGQSIGWSPDGKEFVVESAPEDAAEKARLQREKKNSRRKVTVGPKRTAPRDKSSDLSDDPGEEERKQPEEGRNLGGAEVGGKVARLAVTCSMISTDTSTQDTFVSRGPTLGLSLEDKIVERLAREKRRLAEQTRQTEELETQLLSVRAAKSSSSGTARLSSEWDMPPGSLFGARAEERKRDVDWRTPEERSSRITFIRPPTRKAVESEGPLADKNLTVATKKKPESSGVSSGGGVAELRKVAAADRLALARAGDVTESLSVSGDRISGTTPAEFASTVVSAGMSSGARTPSPVVSTGRLVIVDQSESESARTASFSELVSQSVNPASKRAHTAGSSSTVGGTEQVPSTSASSSLEVGGSVAPEKPVGSTGEKTDEIVNSLQSAQRPVCRVLSATSVMSTEVGGRDRDDEDFLQQLNDGGVGHIRPVKKFVEMTEADESRLLDLVCARSPAWKLRSNVADWLQHFPGCDPREITRRYEAIIAAWKRFRGVSDVIRHRDDQSSEGFSTTLLRGLHDFGGKGRFE